MYQFTPRELSGLGVWLDAMDYSTLTFSTGNDISAVRNKGNAGVSNFAQSTASLQPLYVNSAINSRPAIQFYDDSTAKRLVIADESALDYTAFTIFNVFQRVTDLGATEVISSKWTASGSLREHQTLINSGDQVSLGVSSNGSATAFAAASSTISTGTPVLSMHHIDGSSAYTERVGTIQGTTGTGTVFNGTSGYSVGDLVGGSAPFAGYIGEHLFFKRNLTSVEKVRIRNYLAVKWGLVI